MRFFLRTFTFLALLIAPCAPLPALAHATPIEMVPASGAVFESAPQEISIRFSERLEEGASRIRLTDTSGSVIADTSSVNAGDPHRLTLPLAGSSLNGTYIILWSVVSADDGHFTKGSYAFSVGTSTIPGTTPIASIVTIAAYPEIVGIFVEFLGNSILWGFTLMYALILRTLAQGGPHEATVRRIYTLSLVIGITLALLGGAAQIGWKSFELANLHEIALAEALLLYIKTAAGSATLFRMAAIVSFGAVLKAIRRRLALARGFSVFDMLLIIPLLGFAFFRATISHATANPFFPELSILVNGLHLIEKDMWLGVILSLVTLCFSHARELVAGAIPRMFKLLAINFAALSATASYIVWLHLKDFSNLSSTEWGTTFALLLGASLMVVGMRSYHVFTYAYHPVFFEKKLPFTLGAEAGAALLVVFFSSAVIITSPPISLTGTVFSDTQDGVSIQLERSPYEDDVALLTIDGSKKEPSISAGPEDGGLRIALTKRFEGGYVFPLALIQKETRLSVIVPQEDGYDIHAAFDIQMDDFEKHEGHGRAFDLFTYCMIACAVLAIVFALTLSRIGKRTPQRYLALPRNSAHLATLGIAVGLIIGYEIAMGVGFVFKNDFKTACIKDGNPWHLMQPMKAGVVVSETAREGCMLANGQYHFSDGREYTYLRSLPDAEVVFEALNAVAGIPTTLSFKLTEEDGTPALLSVEHERFLHVVIISKDLGHFAHMHPEETGVADVQKASFSLPHTFPKAGEYLVAIDYLHGLTHETKRFSVEVGGTPNQHDGAPVLLRSPQTIGQYEISLHVSQPFSGSMTTLSYTIMKNGKPVFDLAPYLGAAMHLAIVKNDLSEFIHGHGEVNTPGVLQQPAGTHIHIPPPPAFGPYVNAHVIFPTPGLYTVFSEFAHEGTVHTSAFTVRIE